MAAQKVYIDSLLQLDYNTVLKLKYKHNSVLGQQIRNAVVKLGPTNFELGDKLYKLLPSYVRGEQAKRGVYKIKSKLAQILTGLKDIDCDCDCDF